MAKARRLCEPPGTWRRVGRWEVGDRAPAKKKAALADYSHHRPRSGNNTVLQPVRATETRP
jgi:hypothetical protein